MSRVGVMDNDSGDDGTDHEQSIVSEAGAIEISAHRSHLFQ